MPCIVVVGYQHFGGLHPEHGGSNVSILQYMESQPSRPQLEIWNNSTKLINGILIQ